MFCVYFLFHLVIIISIYILCLQPMLVKQCHYDNNNLEHWDVIVYEDNWHLVLWIHKATYHDGSTDCSWHYVKVDKDLPDEDIQGCNILFKLEWEDADVIRDFIMK